MGFSIFNEVKFMCKKLCKSKVEAEDLQQTVMFKICRSRNCINRPEYLKTWVHNVVVNTYIDVYCRTKRETPFSYLKESTHLYDTEGNEICISNYTLGVDESISRTCERLSVDLSPIEKNIIEKTVFQGYSSRDVCENMKITANVLAKTKTRAMAKMRKNAKISDCPPTWMS